MPELPDLAIVADAFDAALVGQVVERVFRRGKHLVVRLDPNELWAAPMLSGRFALVAPTAGRPKPAISLELGPRVGPARPPAAWIGRAPWLPASDAAIEVRYLDQTRMGKLYLAPAGDPSGVPGVAALGPDADDPALDLETWRTRIRRHPGELKALLRNQSFVAGLGNAYSDEVLWAAGLSPFRRRSSLAADEVDALHAALGTTIADALATLRVRVPPTFERQVRDHLRVHLRGGEPCPRCGATISQVGRREATSFCRACQR